MKECMVECWTRVKVWKKVLLTVVLVYLTLAFLYEYHYESIRSLLPVGRNRAYKTQLNQNSSALRVHIHQWISQGGVKDVVHRDEGNSPLKMSVDIHLEHPVLGHTAEVDSQHSHVSSPDSHKTVAIGGGITSSKLQGVTKDNIPQKFQFFFTLLPSFCKSASTGYHYHFYLAYDHVDTVFSDKALAEAFHQHFTKKTGELCPKQSDTSYSLHLVQCSHHKKPAWAQNDAMMEAYLDNMEYFYRVNDDSDLRSRDWTNTFIHKLDEYKPPKVGVVGPKHHGGNTAILTYDFVHKTHVDIYGVYYPRFFTDWYADDWVTKVYQPGHCTKMSEVTVMHTMKLGQRYSVDWTKTKGVGKQINNDKKTLARYLQYRNKYKDPPKVDGKKVISMSMYGNNPLYTMGVLRNAQITPVFFPGWVLRVYVPYAEEKSEKLQVPGRILSKLLDLGVQLAYVNTSTIKIPPKYWRYLVADDADVEVFIVRNAESRLRDRDSEAVNLWLENWQTFHCVRDHPKHGSKAVVEGLWGAKSGPLRQILGTMSMLDLLQADPEQLKAALEQADIKVKGQEGVDILTDVLWGLVKDYALCHDSVSCNDWPSTQTFPLSRSENLEYLGEVYDIYQQSTANDKADLKPGSGSCVGKQPVVSKMPDTVSLPGDRKSKLHLADSQPAAMVTTPSPTPIKVVVQSNATTAAPTVISTKTLPRVVTQAVKTTTPAKKKLSTRRP